MIANGTRVDPHCCGRTAKARWSMAPHAPRSTLPGEPRSARNQSCSASRASSRVSRRAPHHPPHVLRARRPMSSAGPEPLPLRSCLGPSSPSQLASPASSAGLPRANVDGQFLLVLLVSDLVADSAEAQHQQDGLAAPAGHRACLPAMRWDRGCSGANRSEEREKNSALILAFDDLRTMSLVDR